MLAEKRVDLCADTQVRQALFRYIESGHVSELREILVSHPNLVSGGSGDYPDVHRLMDVVIDGSGFRVCRRISDGKSIRFAPINDISNVPGVPLWLSGERLILWAAHEEENPADSPFDWIQYR